MTNNKYFMYHNHTMFSNPTMMDSITKPEGCVAKAKKLGMTAVAFTEHGNNYKWKHKKDLVNGAGLKYVHGVEFYVTETLEDKLRDNYHMVLLAKNYEGVKEINKLVTKSFNKEDLHFYYRPRISFDELINTSDNIIVTSACLGGILNDGENKPLQIELLKFMLVNKDRCFLEIQHHNIEEQKAYNKKLLDISEKTGIRLIAGTDTHSLDRQHEKAREIMQKSKGIFFEEEDSWDLKMKSYDELVQAYKEQGALEPEVYLQAIENTNVVEDMVEDFEFDTSHKYPKLYDDSEQVFKEKIAKGLLYRGADLQDPVVSERVNREYQAFKKTGTIDYMLLEDDVKQWCRDNNIPYGYGRGSASGSYIAYLMQITEMDSIKHNLIYERFINPDRVSMPDIDTDYSPSQRALVKQYLHSKEGVYCADIITFNTFAVKGTIKAVCRALDKTVEEGEDLSAKVDNCYTNIKTYREQLEEAYDEDIAKQLKKAESELESIRNNNKKVFEVADIILGTVESVGSHPAGVIVSPHPLDGVMGLCRTSTNPNPVSVMDMGEVEALNYVKLDLLVIDTMEVIHKTCELAGIPMVTPDNLDTSDMNVWKSIRESSVGIFQWESASAFSYYNKLFDDFTIDKIKKNNPNVDLIDIFSMGNGAIRPSGESYRTALSKGMFNSNGHKALDEFLSSTQGYLVYQEQIMAFLNKFCGFSMAQSDTVRRAIGKKGDTGSLIPQIKQGFINTMEEEYDTCRSEAEEIIEHFLQIILDASDYGFSVNHSQSYSYLGFATAYLRHYYPLEFIASALTVSEKKRDKTASIFNYMRDFTDVTMKPVKFRYSGGDYSIDKKNNYIYKGLQSIKYLNSKIADELLELGEREYTSFIDLLVDTVEETSCNKRHIDILIRLDFFEEFGDIGKLLYLHDTFRNGKGIKYARTYVENTKIKRIQALKEIEDSNFEYEEFRTIDKIISEVSYMGYGITKDESLGSKLMVVASKELNKYGTAFLDMYIPHTGENIAVKIKGKEFSEKPLEVGDVVEKMRLVYAFRPYSSTEKEWVLELYRKMEV